MSPDEVLALRKERGWTRRQLAERLGVDVAVVDGWETGSGFPTKKNLARMQAMLAGEDEGKRRVKSIPEESPWSALGDPAVWAVVRKLAAHPRLREEVMKLADAYDDPAEAARSGPDR